MADDIKKEVREVLSQARLTLDRALERLEAPERLARVPEAELADTNTSCNTKCTVQ
jgi:hypothetical protein